MTKIITSKADIANGFNNYFVNVDPDLALKKGGCAESVVAAIKKKVQPKIGSFAMLDILG